MFKEIPKSDITVKPFKVYKEYSLTEEDISPYFGKQVTGSLYDPETDELTNGISKRILYDSVKVQFYNNPSTSSVLKESGLRKSYTSTDERNLDGEFGLLVVPLEKKGEGMKIGSVTLTDGGETYTDDSNSNLLSGSGEIVGNIFYSQGLVILTQDIVSGSTLSNFQLDYRSTTTIYENEIFLEVLPNEFNISQNPSSVDDGKFIKYNNFTSSYALNQPTSSIVTGGFGDYYESSSVDPTGSYLAPFVTTIGLYDDNGAMVATAKLAQPIKNLPDYPLNFLIRFDT